METMRTLGPDARRRCPRSCCCRASRRCTCGCRGTANRRWPSRSISRVIRRSRGSTIRCCRAIRDCALRAALPAARRRRHPDVRRQGRRRGRRALHRGRAIPVAPRQRRRREDADHPSGVDDAPPARRGRAARRGRLARDDPPVDRPRVARRHPVGPRPGARHFTTRMQPHEWSTLPR